MEFTHTLHFTWYVKDFQWKWWKLTEKKSTIYSETWRRLSSVLVLLCCIWQGDWNLCGVQWNLKAIKTIKAFWGEMCCAIFEVLVQFFSIGQFLNKFHPLTYFYRNKKVKSQEKSLSFKNNKIIDIWKKQKKEKERIQTTLKCQIHNFRLYFQLNEFKVEYKTRTTINYTSFKKSYFSIEIFLKMHLDKDSTWKVK